MIKVTMKKYTLIMLSMIITGCSNLPPLDVEQSLVKNVDNKIECKKIYRHKNLIKQCRPINR